MIDADSFWIDGYFEETKMRYVCVGQAATATLMGYDRPIEGMVESITRGISTSDAATSTQGLPDVNPVYTWVRLAQRVPVRIRITRIPVGVPLVAGMTATVSLNSSRYEQEGRGLAGLRRLLGTWLDDPADPATPCSIASPAPGQVATLLPPVLTVPLSASDVDPGLTPGMTLPPARSAVRSLSPPRAGR